MRPTLLALAVSAIAAAPAAHASSLPENGYYSGSDATGASITFEFSHDSVVKFDRRGSYFIAQATLTPGQAAFKKTEGNHIVDAHWTSSTRVAGTVSYLVLDGNRYVRHTKSFSATRQHRQDLIIPFVGSYSGTDSAGRTVHFRFDGTDVRNLSLNGSVLLNQGYAAGGSLSTSQNGVHFTMQWKTDTTVHGTVSRNGGTSTFTARAT